MKIYISIPISGHDLATQQAKAAKIAKKIKALGHEPVNPLDTPPPPDEYNSKQKYAYYMGRSIELLLNCDAIYLCVGWRDGKGCRIEYEAAAELHLILLSSLNYIPRMK